MLDNGQVAQVYGTHDVYDAETGLVTIAVDAKAKK
jgi:hypothetical protein